MPKKCVYPKCYTRKDGERCLAPNSWIIFLRNNSGRGYSRADMSRLFVEWKNEHFPSESTVTQRRIILCNDIELSINAANEAEQNAQAAQAAAALAAQASAAAEALAREANVARIDLENARRRTLQQSIVARAACQRAHDISVTLNKSRMKSFRETRARANARANSVISASRKRANQKKVARIDRESSRRRILRNSRIARADEVQEYTSRLNLNKARIMSFRDARKRANARAKSIEESRKRSHFELIQSPRKNPGKKISVKKPRKSLEQMTVRAEIFAKRRFEKEARELVEAQKATRLAQQSKTPSNLKKSRDTLNTLEKTSSENNALLDNGATNETPAEIAEDARNLARSASESSSLATTAAAHMRNDVNMAQAKLVLAKGKTREEVDAYINRLDNLYKDNVEQRRHDMFFEKRRISRVNKKLSLATRLAGPCSLKDGHVTHFKNNLKSAFDIGNGWDNPGRPIQKNNEDNCKYVSRTAGILKGVNVKEMIGSGAQGYVFVATNTQRGPQAVKVSFFQGNTKDGLLTFWYGVHIHRQIQAKLGNGLLSVPKPRYATTLSRGRVSDPRVRHEYAGVFYMDFKNATDVKSLLRTERAHQVVKKYAKALRLLHSSRFSHGDAHTENFMEENSVSGKMVAIDLDRAVDMRGMNPRQRRIAIEYDVSMAFMSLKYSMICIHPVHSEDRDSIWDHWVKVFAESYTAEKNPTKISHMGFEQDVKYLSELNEKDKGPLYDRYFHNILVPHVKGTEKHIGKKFYSW